MSGRVQVLSYPECSLPISERRAVRLFRIHLHGVYDARSRNMCDLHQSFYQLPVQPSKFFLRQPFGPEISQHAGGNIASLLRAKFPSHRLDG